MSNVNGTRYPESVVMPFGKYKGRTLGDIVADDPAYFDWAITKVERPTLLEAVIAIHKKYEPEIERALDQREFRRSER